MRGTPCTTLTIVPATEPMQWYRGTGRMIRGSTGVWGGRLDLSCSQKLQKLVPLVSRESPARPHPCRVPVSLSQHPPHLQVQFQALA